MIKTGLRTDGVRENLEGRERGNKNARRTEHLEMKSRDKTEE